MKKNELTFEDAMTRMEEIVKKLENPDTPLHESYTLYEEGVKLTQRMKKELNEIEKKVKVLLKNDTDGVDAHDFAIDNEQQDES